MEQLSIIQINEKLSSLKTWSLENNGKSIERIFKFQDFKEAISFVNKVSEIAEQEGHHPDINIFSYNKVNISLSTHSVGGLTGKDFKVAYEIDKL